MKVVLLRQSPVDPPLPFAPLQIMSILLSPYPWQWERTLTNASKTIVIRTVVTTTTLRATPPEPPSHPSPRASKTPIAYRLPLIAYRLSLINTKCLPPTRGNNSPTLRPATSGRPRHNTYPLYRVTMPYSHGTPLPILVEADSIPLFHKSPRPPRAAAPPQSTSPPAETLYSKHEQ